MFSHNAVEKLNQAICVTAENGFELGFVIKIESTHGRRKGGAREGHGPLDFHSHSLKRTKFQKSFNF